jgi:hypothetical protein
LKRGDALDHLRLRIDPREAGALQPIKRGFVPTAGTPVRPDEVGGAISGDWLRSSIAFSARFREAGGSAAGKCCLMALRSASINDAEL